MEMSAAPKRLITGTMASNSSDSPELEIAIKTSDSVTMPRSPCAASAGWTNMAGVPVEAKVAAIFRAIWPDFPIPETTTRPLHCKRICRARANSLSAEVPNLSFKARMASDSICRVSLANASARLALLLSKRCSNFLSWVTLMRAV